MIFLVTVVVFAIGEPKISHTLSTRDNIAKTAVEPEIMFGRPAMDIAVG